MKVAHTIKLQTYSCQLIFILTDQLKLESKKIYKKFKLIMEEDEGESEGIVLSPDIDKYFLIIDIKYLTHNTLAHEIYHAVVKVTEERDVTDEEAQAWVSGHITGAIYKFLDKKKFEVKHGF
jgi:predicted RND superfamily exporter protein